MECKTSNTEENRQIANIQGIKNKRSYEPYSIKKIYKNDESSKINTGTSAAENNSDALMVADNHLQNENSDDLNDYFSQYFGINLNQSTPKSQQQMDTQARSSQSNVANVSLLNSQQPNKNSAGVLGHSNQNTNKNSSTQYNTSSLQKAVNTRYVDHTQNSNILRSQQIFSSTAENQQNSDLQQKQQKQLIDNLQKSQVAVENNLFQSGSTTNNAVVPILAPNHSNMQHQTYQVQQHYQQLNNPNIVQHPNLAAPYAFPYQATHLNNYNRQQQMHPITNFHQVQPLNNYQQTMGYQQQYRIDDSQLLESKSLFNFNQCYILYNHIAALPGPVSVYSGNLVINHMLNIL